MASTSSNSENLINIPPEVLRAQDIKTKMKLSSNIVHACMIEGEHCGLLNELDNVFKRTKSYTNAAEYTIYKAIQNMRKDRLSIDKEQERIIKKTVISVSYDLHRQIYINTLLVKHKIPTIRTFASLYRGVYLSKIRFELRENGFTLVKIPGTKSSILIEKPEQVRRRCEYFTKLANFRTEGRNIIYIDERTIGFFNAFDEHIDAYRPGHYSYMIMAANRKGLIHVFFYNNIDSIGTFLQEIAQKIKEPSVIVLGEKQYHERNLCPSPTQFSTKKEMSEFLTINDIPHEPNMPKAEMYSIIQRCKSTCRTEIYSLDQLLSVYGHEILRRPYGSHSLVFFKTIWETAKQEIQLTGRVKHTLLKNDILNFIRDFSAGDWAKMEDNLIETENRMYTEDLQVEETIDKIMMMAKDGNLPDDFNSQDDLDKGVDHHLENVVDTFISK